MNTTNNKQQSVKDVAGLKCKGCSACAPSSPLFARISESAVVLNGTLVAQLNARSVGSRRRSTNRRQPCLFFNRNLQSRI
jgi:hypothetical protein